MVWAPVFCHRFVGRARQLDVLAERFRAAARGEGSAVLIAGESGIGKTRLVSEFCARLRRTNERAAIGHALDYAQAPLAPVFAVLNALGIAEDGDTDSDRLPLFNRIVDALAQASAACPTAIVLEDLHWADDATLAFLQHLTTRLAPLRTLLVCTYRTDAPRKKSALSATLARIEREPRVQHITIPPLDAQEMRDFIRCALEDRFVFSPEVLERIVALAEGNPLFTEQLLKSAADAPMDTPVRLPLSIQHAVNERLAHLRKHEVSLLEHAAVVGYRFELNMLTSVLDSASELVLHALRRAAELQLLVEESAEEPAYAFRHAIIREVVYRRLHTAERRHLHARVARELERRPPSRTQTAELAYHYLEAREREQAGRYNELAGDACVALHANTDAVRFYARAIRAGAAQGPDLAHLERKRAEAALNAGLPEVARVAYARACELYELGGSLEEAAHCSLQEGRVCWHAGDPAGGRTLTRRALALVERLPESATRFAALVVLGFYAKMDGEAAQALHWLHKAERSAGEKCEADRLRLHEFLGGAYAILGDADAAIREFLEAIGVAERAGDQRDLVRALANCALDLVDLGCRERALEFFERAAQLAEREHLDGLFHALALVQYAFAGERFGLLKQAAALVARASALAPMNPTVEMLAAAAAIPVALQLEDEALLERYATAALLERAFFEKHSALAALSSGFVELYVSQGHVAEATELLHRLSATWDPPQDHVGDGWPFVQAAMYGDDDDLARALRSLECGLERRPKRLDLQAYLAVIRACAAKRGGSREEAQREAERAAGLFAELAWPYREACALELAGRKGEALDRYRTIGDRHDVRRLEAALRPTNARGHAKFVLTARERDITSLIAEGLSNKAIARRLLIGERTVETHVASVLQKLGASSRLELALRLAREGVIKPAESP